MTNQDTGDVLFGWGGRLLAARTAAGLSRRALAHDIGVSTKTIQRWEAAAGAYTTQPSPIQQRRLANVLNLSVTELFPRSDDEADLVSLAAALGNGCS